MLAFASGVLGEKQRACTLRIEPGKHWWAGVTNESHRMPFTADSKFELDFSGNTAGNQGQPLLISNYGRFIWPCAMGFSAPARRISPRRGARPM
jgi:hypothetical protein